jgi:hypothetical protein
MSATLTVTKTDASTFTIHSSEPVKGPAQAQPGQSVPVDWLISFLEYYKKHADPQQGLPVHKRHAAPW